MKRIAYINGARIGGAPSNVQRLKMIKRSAAGVVSWTAAPTATASVTAIAAAGTPTTTTKTMKIGLTGQAGGRNFIKAKFQVINTTAKAQTLTAKVKTIAGTQTLGTKKATATTISTTTSNTAPIPIDVPGTLVVKAKAAAGKITSIKALTIQVNQLTTVMF